MKFTNKVLASIWNVYSRGEAYLNASSALTASQKCETVQELQAALAKDEYTSICVIQHYRRLAVITTTPSCVVVSTQLEKIPFALATLSATAWKYVNDHVEVSDEWAILQEYTLHGIFYEAPQSMMTALSELRLREVAVVSNCIADCLIALSDDRLQLETAKYGTEIVSNA